MTKFLFIGSLLAFSTLATACSDKDQAEKLKEKSADTVVMQDERQAELEKRKKRAEQKGNGLDSFNSTEVVQPEQKNKKSNNGLDSFKPN